MSRVKPAGTARARTRMELTMALVELHGLRKAGHHLSRENIQRHTRYLANVGQALSTFLSIEDAAGIHDSCVLIWNASLVLLQKDLRHHVKDIFRAAAEALERIDSPMHRLRAQFHLEVSKCFIEEDMLLPATRENQKALSLDYLVGEDEMSSSGYTRPLDRYLEPMQKKLRLKCAIYLLSSGWTRCPKCRALLRGCGRSALHRVRPRNLWPPRPHDLIFYLRKHPL